MYSRPPLSLLPGLAVKQRIRTKRLMLIALNSNVRAFTLTGGRALISRVHKRRKPVRRPGSTVLIFNSSITMNCMLLRI